MRRNLKVGSTSIKQTACKSFIRPILVYASTVWDPRTQHVIDKIEAIQRRAARCVLRCYHRTYSVKDMLEVLQWPSLQQRHHIARLTMLYKINNSHISATGLNSANDAATAISSHSSSVAVSTISTRSCQELSGNGTTCQLPLWRPAQSTLPCQGPPD